jgi:catechol 2,3-dioxygenase-like lactoylglutathione lyase family enzyme
MIMQSLKLLTGIVVAALGLPLVCTYYKNDIETHYTMKMNAGIITDKLEQTKTFYTEVLNFGITFENDFYLLMHTPDHGAEISFLLPDHPSQQPLFQSRFNGKGVYLTIEVNDVDAEYERMRKAGIPIVIALRDEPWGDRHFAIVDPNGIGIDIVTYKAVTN